MFNAIRQCVSMLMLLTIFLLVTSSYAMEESSSLALDGFRPWVTGSDTQTIQLAPTAGTNALTLNYSIVVAHVKFNVVQYGEMSFPINPNTLPNQEALKADLSKSNFIKLTYKANQSVVLQLRQTGVHGGVQNHVVLPPSVKWVTRKIYFSAFDGGLKPLNLTDVAKFNFAFLSNNEKDGYAELSVKSFRIDRFEPRTSE